MTSEKRGHWVSKVGDYLETYIKVALLCGMTYVTAVYLAELIQVLNS